MKKPTAYAGIVEAININPVCKKEHDKEKAITDNMNNTHRTTRRWGPLKQP
jgi:hypothetical protein